MSRAGAILGALLAGIVLTANAQVTNTVTTTDDAFVCTGSSNYNGGEDLTGLNYGGAGTLVVAPASSSNGVFLSVLKFNLSNGVALFNSTYGSNQWTIASVTLDLTSNFGAAGADPDNPLFGLVSGGQFVIEWLADDDWVEGTGTPKAPTTDGVTYDSLPTLLAEPSELLCTNTYVPPGKNVHVFWPLPLTSNLVANLAAGGQVSFLFYAADNQINYLFNSHEFGGNNEPLIHVVATTPLRIVSGMFTGGAFHLIGIGNDNSSYNVQASTSLSTTNWQTIGTVVSDASGTIEFDDTNAPSLPWQFYRLSQ
jgi:hypothetical protein